MFPRKFEYVAPQSLDEAVSALKSSDSAKVMSGDEPSATHEAPAAFARTRGRHRPYPGLDSIDDGGDMVTIGALVRHYQTSESSAIPRALASAAAYTGDVQVRNRGTTVGAVVHGDLAADQPAAFLALGGIVVTQGPNGVREIPAADFFVDTLTTAIAPDEVATAIKVPRGGSSAYDKLGRRGGHTDYAVAGRGCVGAKRQWADHRMPGRPHRRLGTAHPRRGDRGGDDR